MEKLNVKLPAIQRALRSRSPLPNVSNNGIKPKKSSKERVRKYREKLKSDPQHHAKLQEMKEKKKAENKAYKDKIRALRKSNTEVDKKYKKKMQKKWNNTRKEQKQSKVKKTTDNEKKILFNRKEDQGNNTEKSTAYQKVPSK